MAADIKRQPFFLFISIDRTNSENSHRYHRENRFCLQDLTAVFL